MDPPVAPEVIHGSTASRLVFTGIGSVKPGTVHGLTTPRLNAINVIL
jgi:hypothetical protein